MGRELGSLLRATTGTAVMSHASRQGSGPRPGVEVALPGARRCGPDPALGGPARAQTERVWLSNQAADPQPAGAARVCAPACACARGR